VVIVASPRSGCPSDNTVIAREGGQSSTPRLLRIPLLSLEHRITAFAGDDTCFVMASRINKKAGAHRAGSLMG